MYCVGENSSNLSRRTPPCRRQHFLSQCCDRQLFLVLLIFSAWVSLSQQQECVSDSFVSTCQLGPGERLPGRLWSNQTAWRRCVPKSCGDFHAVANGIIFGSPALVGHNVTVHCNHGYHLAGGTHVVECLHHCDYNGTRSCEAVECPPVYIPNSHNLTEGLFGNEADVHCLPGFKANTSWPTFNSPCSTSFRATCSANGTWDYATECVPVTCPAYDADDASLKCADENKCSIVGAVVATAKPRDGIDYLEYASIECDAGYELIPFTDEEDGEYPATYLSQCTSTCQYTSNTRKCQPRQCTGFKALGDASVDSTSQFLHKSLSYRCNDGFAIHGQEHTWSDCADEQVVLCSLVVPVNATTGAFTAVRNDTHFTLDSHASELLDAYVGMTLVVGSEEVRIIESSARTVVVEHPLQTTPAVGSRYKVMSVFNPPQSELKCTAVTHTCGAYSVAVGTYSPADVNVKRDSLEPPIVAQGDSVDLSCIDGHRVVDAADAFSCSAGGRLADCAESGEVLYTRTCGGCRYFSDQACRIVECEPHHTDAHSEERPAVNTSLFAGTLTVECKPGFKTGLLRQDGARGVGLSPVGGSSFTRLCGVQDENIANDRTLQDPDPTPCFPITCGAFAMLPNMTLVSSSPNWTAATEYVHADPPLVLECAPGYRRHDTVSTFAEPCNGTVMAWCSAGAWMYNLPGEERPALSAAPTCVLMDCGSASDSCGSESCAAVQSLEHGAMLDDSAATALTIGEMQQVHCVTGYRAAATGLKESASVTCELPRNYSRACGYCVVHSMEECRPVTCGANETVDANGDVHGDRLVEFSGNASIVCHAGYRAATAEMPDAHQPRTYPVTCRDNCSLVASAPAMRCRLVTCSLASIPNASRVGVTAIGNTSVQHNATVTAMHEQVVEFRCLAGFKRNGTDSWLEGPCNASIWARCSDGVPTFSADGVRFDIMEPPACVPITGCRTRVETCGHEGCATFQNEDNNSMVVGNGSLAHGQSLTVQCNEGYRAHSSGSAALADCSEPSSYEVGCTWCAFDHQNICRPVECVWDAISDHNGEPELTTAMFGGSVTVHCSADFRATSHEFASAADPPFYAASCNSNCSFASQLSCRPLTCDAVVGNASMVMAAGHPASGNGSGVHVREGDNVSYMCAPGYQSSPRSKSNCSQRLFGVCVGGKLSLQSHEAAASAACHPKTCPALDPVDHPNATIPYAGPHGIAGPPGEDSFEVNVTCKDGFRVGPNISVLPSGIRVYSLNCSGCLWNSTRTRQCVRGKCAGLNYTTPPAFVESFSPMFAAADGVLFGEKVDVKCQEGYRVVGDNTRQDGEMACTDDGFSPPNMTDVCTRLQCDNFTVPENAVEATFSFPILWGEPKQYTCNTGFNVEGGYCWETTGSATCDAQGTWADVPPCIETPSSETCFLRDQFADPPSPILTHGSLTTIHCQDRHASVPVSHEPFVFCNANLTTSYEVNCTHCHPERAAQCKPLACPETNWNVFDDAVISWAPTGIAMIGDEVRLMCAEGFRGGDHESDGCSTEDDPRPFCPPSAPRELLVVCEAEDAVQCSFSSQKIKCKPVTCGSAPSVLNGVVETGAVDGGVFVFGNNVTVECDPGFRIEPRAESADMACSSVTTSICTASGIWEPVACVPVECITSHGEGVIRDPDVDRIGFDDTIHVSCETGYSPEHGTSGTRQCMRNCMLDHELDCERVHCEVDQHLPNAQLLVEPPILFPMTVPVQCDEGYIASGDALAVDGKCSAVFNRQCLYDGSLSLPGVDCVVATCPSAADHFAGLEGLGGLIENATLVLNHSDPRTAAPAHFGFGLMMHCADGYSLNGMDGAGSESSFMLRCGVGEPEHSRCEWEHPTERCLPRGWCSEYRPWNHTAISTQASGVVTGTCSTEKTSISQGPGECGREWVATCAWDHASDSWQWTHKGADGPVLHAESSSCPNNATCVIPSMENTAFTSPDQHSVHAGEEVTAGATVTWSCARGYGGMDGVHNGVMTCMPATCELLPPPSQCELQNCIADSLLMEFDFTTAREVPLEYGQQLLLGESVEVHCKEGFTLDFDTSPPEEVDIGGEAVKVVAQQRFPPPSATVETTYTVTEFPGVSIRFPPGAWPVGDSRPLRLSVLDIGNSSSLSAAAGRSGGSKIAGRGVFYEPSGIRFLQPVELALPYDATADYGLFELAVHVWDAQNMTWLRKPFSSSQNSPVDAALGVVYAETLSFSTYASLAVPPATTPPPATTANVSANTTTAAPATTPAITPPTSTPIEPEEDEDDDNRVGIIIGSVIGGVVGMVLIVWGCYSCQKRGPATKRDADEPLVVNPEPHAQPAPIAAAEARSLEVQEAPGGPALTREVLAAPMQPQDPPAQSSVPIPPLAPIEPELVQQAARQRELDTVPATLAPTMATTLAPTVAPTEPTPSSEAELQQLLAEARRKDEEERMLAGMAPMAQSSPPDRERWKAPNETTFSQRVLAANPPIDPPPPLAPDAIRLAMQLEEPEAYHGSRIDIMSTPRDAPTLSEEKSPFDTLSISDIASLLPPGWLCCVGCAQPVNSSWNKCPKCGTVPGMAPSGTM